MKRIGAFGELLEFLKRKRSRVERLEATEGLPDDFASLASHRLHFQQISRVLHNMSSDPEDTRAYKVVINDEEQYSIWFADRDPPAGWREVGKTGQKQECLAYIKEAWT